MRLKKLEMYGFKSFANKVTLEFPDGITAIVGPNGSGKSNVLDATMWVLGEQSAKSLRGAKMEDIIFAGTATRKQVGFAEVSITLDNSDSKMNIEFNEVTVTRRLYRSGESQYFINKAACRLKDIHQLFMDTGLGRDGYSIIGQGKIDEILNARPENRRNIFEEAAGIIKYRTRKEETEHKIADTEANLVRVNDIIYSLQDQIEPLKKQSEEAKEYIKVRDELKELEVGLFLEEIDKINSELQKLNEQKNENSLNMDNESIKYEEYKEIRVDKNEKLEELTKSLEVYQKNSYEIEAEIQNDVNSQKINNEKISNFNQLIDKNKAYVKDINSRIEECEEKKNSINQNIVEFEEELKSNKAQFDDLNVGYEKDNSTIRQMEEEIENQKVEVVMYLNDISNRNASINTLKGLKQNINSAIVKLQNQKNEFQENKNLFITKKESLIVDKNGLTLEFEELKEKIATLNSQKDKTFSKLSHDKEQLENLIVDLRGLKSRFDILVDMEKEFEGYSKSVKSLLKRCEEDKNLSKGVNGALAQLIKSDKKYEIALETCLGASLQNIVTDTEEDAKRLIEYLKRNNLGRATFLPVSIIKGRYVDERSKQKISSCEGFLGIGSEIVEYNGKFKEIVGNLLGRVIIADNIDNAIKIARLTEHSFKIVTLSGDILNPGGSMSGGSQTHKNSGFLSRSREIEEMQKSMEAKSEARIILQKEIEIMKEDFKAIEEKLYSLNKRKQELEVEISKLEGQIDQADNEIKIIIKRIEVLDGEEKQVIEQVEESDKSLLSEEKELSIKLEEKELLEEKIRERQEELSKLRASLEGKNSSLNDTRIEISRLQQAISTAKERIEDVNREIKSFINDVKTREVESNNSVDLIKELETSNAGILAAIEKQQEEKQKVEQEIVNCQKELLDLKSYIDNIDKEMNDHGVKLEKLKETIYKNDMNIGKKEVELENSHNRMWDKYNITYANAEEYRIKGEVKAIRSRVGALQNDIKKFGNVNIAAIQEYEKVSEKYEFLTEQKNDLESTIKSLTNVINDVVSSMEQQFRARFDEIKVNFKRVFKNLFGGGDADLVLTDSENLLQSGVDIIVQPPGKKLQNINLLSGGEKALTAISLLFGIFEVKPSPFCILDEIEAALDDANVYRFATYLINLSGETQFLVITHRKGTMERADNLYGVSMEEKGVSSVVSIKLEDKEKYA